MVSCVVSEEDPSVGREQFETNRRRYTSWRAHQSDHPCQIEAWLTIYPSANFGIVDVRAIALDADTRPESNKNGLQHLRDPGIEEIQTTAVASRRELRPPLNATIYVSRESVIQCVTGSRARDPSCTERKKVNLPRLRVLTFERLGFQKGWYWGRSPTALRLRGRGCKRQESSSSSFS
jgi:hypothetical protein